MKRHQHLTFTIIFAALLSIAILVLGPCAPASAEPQGPPAAARQFLPLIAGRAPRTCDLNMEEQQIANIMMSDPGQQRPSLTCDPVLAEVARARAQDMVDRHYFGHTNPDGYGPNYLVTQAGYVLPGYYSTAPDGNNIESIAAGYRSADAAWEGWMGSPAHRTHLLGEIDFFAEQIEYGVGYVRGGDYGHYWVVITAKPGP